LLIARTGWSPTLKTAGFIGLVVVVMAITYRFGPKLPRGGVEEAGPDAVMPGAEGIVSDFEVAGFRRIGGFRWALRGRLVTETVLASPDSECYALVTDRVVEVASRFEDRTLTTINEGRAPLPPDILRQVIRPGGPAELLQAHRAAPELLARRWLQPDRFRDDSETLAAVRASEERALRYGSKISLPTLLRLGVSGGDADRELGDDGESQRRIDAWLGARHESTWQDADESSR
jgi:hypothetical protein